MNNTLLVLTDQTEPLTISPANPEADLNNLISSISLAVCSILLSLGGCMVALQKSKCKTISCLGGVIKIDRTLPIRETIENA